MATIKVGYATSTNSVADPGWETNSEEGRQLVILPIFNFLTFLLQIFVPFHVRDRRSTINKKAFQLDTYRLLANHTPFGGNHLMSVLWGDRSSSEQV